MKKLAFALLLLAGCVQKPSNIQPVGQFDLERYLGRWYEIARLDHSFERGLTHVTADYSLRDDGSVTVINRGYDAKAASWKQAEGTAQFVGEKTQGFLKVSFFKPFYGAYVIFDLDHEGYQYALVTGPSRSYLWILSRTPTISASLRDTLVQKSRENGFAADELIFVDQDRTTSQPAAGQAN